MRGLSLFLGLHRLRKKVRVAEVSAAASPITEGDSAVFTITLTMPTSTFVLFPFSISGVSPSDYNAAGIVCSSGVTISGGQLVVPPGVKTFTITIPTIDDTIHEPTETMTLTVDDKSASVDILDNDTPYVVSVTPQVTPVTEGDQLIFNVVLSTTTGLPISLTYSFSTSMIPSEYTVSFSHGVTLSGGMLQIPVGVSSFQIIVSTNDDSAHEPPESVTATVGGVSASGQVLDNDTPYIVSVTPSSYSINEGDSVTFTVTLSNAPMSTMSFNYVFSGTLSSSEYSISSVSSGVTYSGGQFHVPAGVTSFNVVVQTTTDTEVETTETLTLTVGGVSHIPAVSVVDVPAMTVYNGPALLLVALRRLNPTWPKEQPLIRVRRLTDGVQKDIGSTADGDLDTSDLIAFATNNGAWPTGGARVVVWYNQAINFPEVNNPDALHLVQSTPAAQPLIVHFGQVTSLNGIKAVWFDGVLTAGMGTRKMSTQFQIKVKTGTHDYISSIGTLSDIRVEDVFAIASFAPLSLSWYASRLFSAPESEGGSDLEFNKPHMGALINILSWNVPPHPHNSGFFEAWRPPSITWWKLYHLPPPPSGEFFCHTLLYRTNPNKYTTPYVAAKYNNDLGIMYTGNSVGDPPTSLSPHGPKNVVFRIGGDDTESIHEQWSGYVALLLVSGRHETAAFSRSLSLADINQLRTIANQYYGFTLAPMTAPEYAP